MLKKNLKRNNLNKGKRDFSDKKTSNDPNKSRQYLWIISVVTIIILSIAYFRLDSKVINYPVNISYAIFLITFMSLIFLFLKRNINEFQSLILTKDKVEFIFSRAVLLLTIPYAITLFIKIPINYYVVYFAPKENSEIITCNIDNISFSRKRGYSISFTFDNRNESIKGYQPIIDQILLNKDFKNYTLNLKVRKSIFNCYYIEYWEIKKKIF